jgi:hypothetical protein
MHVARRLFHAICCMLHVARCTVWRKECRAQHPLRALFPLRLLPLRLFPLRLWRKACRAEHPLRALLVRRASDLTAVLAHSLNGVPTICPPLKAVPVSAVAHPSLAPPPHPGHRWIGACWPRALPIAHSACVHEVLARRRSGTNPRTCCTCAMRRECDANATRSSVECRGRAWRPLRAAARSDKRASRSADSARHSARRSQWLRKPTACGRPTDSGATPKPNRKPPQRRNSVTTAWRGGGCRQRARV